MAFSGFLVLDKPLGLTSRAVVDRAIHWFPRSTRLGHTGTLDPLATGVLVVAVGPATRLVDDVQRMDKAYRVTIRLGARSDTDDAEGTIVAEEAAMPPERAAVDQALQVFVGTIEQVPPNYSAAKIAGRRAYVLARRGAEVDLAARSVHIYDLRVLHYAYPDLEIEVRCGKGTYIRSLARDLGERLGCGAYVQVLRRTRVGPFDAGAALSMDAPRDAARAALLDVSWAALGLPRIEVSAEQAKRFAHGQKLLWTGATGDVGVFDIGGSFVGLGRIDDESRLCPTKVFIVP